MNHTNTRANDNIDAAIKEKDQIIQTLKYDLQQQSQRQQQAAPRETQHQHPVVTRQTQQPQYSTVTSICTVHQRDYLPNQQQKNYRASPDQIEGKKKKKKKNHQCVHRRNGILKYGNKKLGKTIPDNTKFALDPYNTVHNLSSKSFSKYEYQLLNKNLNFCPTPNIFNKTILNQEVNKFYRRIKLKAHFKDSKTTLPKEDMLFRKKSNWTPTKKHHSVDTFIDLVNNDLKAMNPKHKQTDNLSQKEKEALEILRNRSDIIITRADKGGAVVIMDIETYIQEAEKQLNDTNYYTMLPHEVTQLHEEKVKHTKYVKKHMRLKRKHQRRSNASRIKNSQVLPTQKIYKKQRPPPGRPVVNTINSPTSNISKYVDHQLQPIVTQLPSYVKNTTDFIKKLDTVKTAPVNCYLVTMDVKSLYTNIPHTEGIDAVRSFMNRHCATSKMTIIVTTLLTLILTLNNFIFNGLYFLQKMGCPMGTKCAPSYANIFMGDFEEKNIYPFINQYSTLYLRYIDDIFMIWKNTYIR